MKKQINQPTNYRINQQRGFTLVEMMAVVFIISLISTLLIANYRRSQKQYALEQAAQKLVSDLRRVQAMAMSGEGIQGTYRGYGIYIKEEEHSYQIFGDNKNDDCLDTATGPPDLRDAVIERVTLPLDVSINAISPRPATGPKTLHICFVPPGPTTYFNGVASPLQATIKLQYGADTSLAKTISINLAGAIKAE